MSYGYEGIDFDDIRVRHAFVRKVLAIVGAQLMLTFCFIALCVYIDDVKLFVLARNNAWIVFVCLGVALITQIALACCSSVRRKFPINIILLSIFTIAESYIIGYICATKYANEVLLAFGVTVLLCAVLILFAWQTKCDFTGFAPYMIIFAILLLIMGIISIFWRNRIFLIIICSIGILVFSFYLIIDIQMMLGGKHRYEYEPEDFILAAISIYIDIITIFIYILQLIGLIGTND